MDTKLDMTGKDFYIDARGILLNTEGLDELRQRVYIALNVPMGKLPYSPAFGGDRVLVEKAMTLGEADSGLLAMAENALSGPLFQQDGVRVVSAVLSDSGRGNIEFESNLGKGSVEVIL